MQGRFDAVAPSLIPLPPTDLPTPDGFAAPMVSAFMEPEAGGAAITPLCTSGMVSTVRDLLRFGTAIANDGVIDGRRVWSKAAIELLTAPTDVRARMPWFPLLDGRRFAMGGCVFESPGDAGITVPCGTWCWGGYYNTILLVHRGSRSVGVASSQVLADIPYHAHIGASFAGGLGAAMVSGASAAHDTVRGGGVVA